MTKKDFCVKCCLPSFDSKAFPFVSLGRTATSPNVLLLGKTIKCAACPLRFHLSCLSGSPSDQKLCDLCRGVATDDVKKNAAKTKWLIEAEKKFTDDWNKDTCFICGDFGRLVICPTCYTEDEPYAQFHPECVKAIEMPASTCPLCYAKDRLEALDELQQMRDGHREERFREKRKSFAKCLDVETQRVCAFCRVEGDNTAAGAFFHEDNVFLGPYVELRNRKKQFWVHNMCALWAPQVHLDRSSKMFVNVELEVARSRSLVCGVCHRHGAALGCYAKGCKKTYHYPCAKEGGCHVNHKLFIIYCPEHFLKDFLKENREKAEQVKIRGMNAEVFEKGRFQYPNERKRRLKSVTSRNVMKRYKSAKEVFQDYIIEKPKCEAVVASDPSEKLGGLKKQMRILKELVIMPLMYPELHTKFRAGRAVLLYGPPGNGKTLLVKEIANKSGKSVSFWARNGPDILSRYHGETEKNLQSVFQKAKDKCPAIIFFDEIDGLCPIRSFKQEQVHNSVVSTLLTLLDELVYEEKKVFVIGATSRVQMVDPAIRRPGRFDREVYVGLPDEETRREILRVHTRAWNDADSEELSKILEDVTKRTSGFSGADLQGLLTEAFLSAIRRVIPTDEPLLDEKRSEKYAELISEVIVIMEDFETHLKKKPEVDKYADLKKQSTYMVDRFLSHTTDGVNKSGILTNDLIGGRLLVDGDGEIGQKQVCDHIIEKANSREISVLVFPEAAAFLEARSFEEFITKKMQNFCEGGRGILIIPRVEEYLAGPTRIVSLLVSLLWDLPRSKPVLLLCYSHMEWSARNVFTEDLDIHFLKLFAKNRFTIHE